MPRTNTAQTIGELINLLARVTPEATAGVLHLEHARERLLGMVDELQKLLVERDFHAARKQEATERIQQLLEEGRRAATMLRLGLKEHLGHDNEQLVAFDIQPFRPRKRARRAASPEDAPPSDEPAP
jgi:hypothetical protein